MNPESQRLARAHAGEEAWYRWGPYLSERQWGTVREDYSAAGEAWGHVTHEAARSKTYRWGEEGLGGLCDDRQRLCFAWGFWNGKDSMLKERLFGLSGPEGNHGEDVKEYYYYLDSTPTHSWMRMLYKYPQAAFPYAELVEENAHRDKKQAEYELIDTGVFDEDRYFDLFIDYAKAGPEDLLIRITAHNRGPEAAELHLVPQLWFRNTWSWNADEEKPSMRAAGNHIACSNGYYLHFDEGGTPLFTENQTNRQRLYGSSEDRGPCKDAINDAVLEGAESPMEAGTKAALHYRVMIEAGGSHSLHLRLVKGDAQPFDPALFDQRHEEADAFYAERQARLSDEDDRRIQRQAWAGLMWTKQFYYYDVARWLEGDPGLAAPPEARRHGRNSEWEHLNNADIISMPDKWEYPWYAAWDLAFHCLPIARIDPEFAKQQLVLLTREWYMHPNGQLPAYEWEFGDVNPPVHAWATWRVYKIDKKQSGVGDYAFLERVFQKLLLNFTWWVNRKDADDNNIFQGGFLGLDNIGVFDRSKPLPTGGRLEQADGTSWMAMYCLNMLKIALELAERNAVYEDLASKFFEHFLYIARAMMNMGGEGLALWDDHDKFYYDALNYGHHHEVLKVRSMVGLIPLFAVETLEPEQLEKVPEFKKRVEWFLKERPELAELVSRWTVHGVGERTLLSLLRGHRMKRLLARMLDPEEFLSDYGVRGLSKHHEAHPYVFHAEGEAFTVQYQPAESDSHMFGGNSNWRGPIWFPVNYLLIESLQKFHHYYGDDFKIECPAGSGNTVTIDEAAQEIARRLCRIFQPGADGRRPVFGQYEKMADDPHFKDHLLFYEYFHGDNGRGVGASHQTGWTALVAELLGGP